MSAMYCQKCGQDSAELLRMIADLRRRVRLARKLARGASADFEAGKEHRLSAAAWCSRLAAVEDALRKPARKGRR